MTSNIRTPVTDNKHLTLLYYWTSIDMTIYNQSACPFCGKKEKNIAISRDGQYLCYLYLKLAYFKYKIRWQWLYILYENTLVFWILFVISKYWTILSVGRLLDDIIKMQNDACSLWMLPTQSFAQACWDQHENCSSTRWETCRLPAFHQFLS